MTKEELKPIDVSKYTVTENGNVIKGEEKKTTKEDLSITYENNIFYCTKNNTKWISVDGEKWYGDEKRIAELEKENAKLRHQLNKNPCVCNTEWHYVKDGDLPKETGLLMSKTLLLVTKMKGSDCLSLARGEYNFSVQEFSYQHIVGLTDVIAWKEIVLPKESE